jgi:4-hydroxy-2-oxoheptanedioate aldolase
VVELVAEAGPDFVVIDRQHGLIGWAEMLEMLRAVARTDVSPLVRVAANDAREIGQALDAGADGVLVPMIHTADQARRAVAACRYPLMASVASDRRGRLWSSPEALLR